MIHFKLKAHPAIFRTGAANNTQMFIDPLECSGSKGAEILCHPKVAITKKKHFSK